MTKTEEWNARVVAVAGVDLGSFDLSFSDSDKEPSANVEQVSFDVGLSQELSIPWVQALYDAYAKRSPSFDLTVGDYSPRGVVRLARVEPGQAGLVNAYGTLQEIVADANHLFEARRISRGRELAAFQRIAAGLGR